MSKAVLEVGEIAAGVGLAVLGGMTGNFMLVMAGIGITMSGIAGLLQPSPPASIGNAGLLPVQQPNANWRIQYGVFQAAAALESFIDGPNLLWDGTAKDSACNNQFLNLVHTLTCHQIAAFLSVTIDGETFNFGSDLVFMTPTNAPWDLNDDTKPLWLPGFWGFSSFNNPYCGYVFFQFDCGDPGNTQQPFPLLLPGTTSVCGRHTIPTGSSKWTSSCLQRGRAKVRIFIDYRPGKDGSPTLNGAQYPIASGRIPKFEFKCAGRIILDPRVSTAWLASTPYAKNQFTLVTVNGVTNIWVQQNLSGESGATIPAFAANMVNTSGATGITLADASCLWLNCGVPMMAAGQGHTQLNNAQSIKLTNPALLGGGGGCVLIADAWQGLTVYAAGTVVEAPIGTFQQVTTPGTSGTNRPIFGTAFGLVKAGDGTVGWTCIGRSPYATALPDNDGTQNTGGISNSALCLYDYLTTPRSEFGLGVTPDAALIESTIAAANTCDEPVLIMVTE